MCRSCATSRAPRPSWTRTHTSRSCATSSRTATTSDQVYRTLSYFDGAVLARARPRRRLFSVALMDRICPPSTVYAAYNRYAGEKRIVEYPFNDHEGGQGFHEQVKLRWLAERLRR